MNFGSITLCDTLGGYEIVNIPANSLPQDVASAVYEANANIVGDTFDPIWYIGRQVVNGVNHLFIAKEICATRDQKTEIVGLAINVPPGENCSKGEGATIAQIIEQKIREYELHRNEIEDQVSVVEIKLIEEPATDNKNCKLGAPLGEWP